MHYDVNSKCSKLYPFKKHNAQRHKKLVILLWNIIKGDNILYNSNGEIKLADFGLSKKENHQINHTNRVVTLWYRAPELLLGIILIQGSRRYDTKIDIWSIGFDFKL
jgi:hypothetical protein